MLLRPKCQLWVTCGRRPGKNFLTFCSIGRVRSRVRPVTAAGMAAGPNALRGSGPNRKHAFEYALTQAGSPDPRNDRICITSSCPRQFVEAFGPCPLCCHRERFRLLEAFPAHHHGPGHACNLVGQCDGSDPDRPAFHNPREPEPFCTVLPGVSDDSHSSRDEQPSQISITLL